MKHLWECTYTDPRDKKTPGRRPFDMIEGTLEDASLLVDRAVATLPAGVYVWLDRA